MNAENLSNWGRVGAELGQCWIMLDNVGNLQYVHCIQSLIISFPDFICHMHVDVLGDGTVCMSQLSGDGLYWDSSFCHQGCVGVSE